jgi:YihY family inner membrane protein
VLEKLTARKTGRWARLTQPLHAPVLRGTAPLRRTVVETYRGFRADRGEDLAASLAFATLIAAVPLLATFSLLFAAFFKENVNEILEVVNAILPYHTARITENLRDFIAESSAISGIGLTVLLVTSVRLIFIVEGVFNAVWGAPRRRGLVARTAVYSLVLLALTLLLWALGLGLRRLRSSAMADSLAGSLFPLVIEFVALTLLYRFLPNARVRWAPALAGAGAVACALEVLRYFFGLYVHALSRMNLITGSLTFILLTLLSLYFVWTLILIGVELTSVLQTHAISRRAAAGSPAGPAEIAIRMLVRMAGGAHLAQDVFDVQDPAAAPEKERLLERLAEAGLVSGSRAEGFTLAMAPELITVARVVEALSPDLYSISRENSDRQTLALERLFRGFRSARRAALSTTIAELPRR